MEALDHGAAPGPGSLALGHPRVSSAEGDPRLAWVLFLLLGLPFALMGILTILARAGFYVDLFRPLWQPWPPEILKPFIGVAGFVGTLAYLAYRIGRRTGFRSGTVAGIVAVRNEAERRTRAEEAQIPPPPPDEPAPALAAQPEPSAANPLPAPPPPDAPANDANEDL
ncbi:MAG TPA: hypothetical protein VEY12_08930 [Thermoplasmata archaeon]|nr:hypothetical protein [Thermoplasmata archaeon]